MTVETILNIKQQELQRRGRVQLSVLISQQEPERARVFIKWGHIKPSKIN